MEVINMQNNSTEILTISFNNDTGDYQVKIPQGSNLNEVFFGINVLIKCLVRDGVVESEEKVYETLRRYATDPQYQELVNETEVTNDDTNSSEIVK